MLKKVMVVALVSSLVALGACMKDEVAELPPPANLTMDAMGYYCSMTVMDHVGSKGHVILDKDHEVFWFSSVRDTIAFTRMPGEPRNIAVIYVSDMSNVEDWAMPDMGKWIDAASAHFVIGSSMRGGMGAPEPVPFADLSSAESFVQEFGGKVVNLQDIPDMMILGTDDMEAQTSEMTFDSITHKTN